MTGEEMTGLVLRARRRRLPGHRNAEEPRSQPEFADDLGYHRNTLAQLERGANALGKRGRVLHLALCTLEREAGLVEWQDLAQEQRAAFVRDAQRDLKDAAREHGSGAQRPASKKGAAKKGRK
jgi:transcriptional regulator with XRE-family HTH domain